MRGRVAGVILFLALGVLGAPIDTPAQQPEKVYRVGLILTTSPVSEMAEPNPVHPLVPPCSWTRS